MSFFWLINNIFLILKIFREDFMYINIGNFNGKGIIG